MQLIPKPLLQNYLLFFPSILKFWMEPALFIKDIPLQDKHFFMPEKHG